MPIKDDLPPSYCGNAEYKHLFSNDSYGPLAQLKQQVQHVCINNDTLSIILNRNIVQTV